MIEKCITVCGSTGKKYPFFFPLQTVQNHYFQFCSLLHEKLHWVCISSVH